jgi:leucyl aminopeptidase
MAERPSVTIAKAGQVPGGTVIVLAAEPLNLGRAARSLGADIEKRARRSAAIADFKAKNATALDLLAPSDRIDRLILLGVGKAKDLSEADWLKLGGAAMGLLKRGEKATVLLERPDGHAISAAEAAEFCLGMVLRSYSFERYKAEKDGDAGRGKPPAEVSVQVADPNRVRRAWDARSAVADGVYLARDLVNEPPNVLGPKDFADRVAQLRSTGLEVEILNEKDMGKLKMGALLGVAQGSARPPRIAIMRWNGGKKSDAPLVFVGKGVVFDSGGISIKPAGGMEDMKGDMGGAAAVTGLMRALAGRKAKVNAVGVIGIVENMPDGNAQRPGDIVTSMSGKTIEIINTDAEGRLVLADVIHYAEQRFKPKLIIDLATLTGAILVALGQQHAGLFSNDDKLSDALGEAGEATGEKVWRMPLGPDYDKMMDSKFADVKNAGGRYAGSITAAHFIKRFVKSAPWAHLDVAGTAMGSPQTEINRSWGSGYGVRLLDRLVSDNYER